MAPSGPCLLTFSPTVACRHCSFLPAVSLRSLIVEEAYVRTLGQHHGEAQVARAEVSRQQLCEGAIWKQIP